MYLRRCYRRKDGKRHAYWVVVESYGTNRGPRQRVVAWLGVMDERGRLALSERGTPSQGTSDARTLREADRRRFSEDHRKLWQTSAEIGRRGASRGTAPGTEHPSGALAQLAGGGARPGVHA